MIHVTDHAAQRYVERIDGSLSIEQAHAIIATHERIVTAAAAFGAPTVRLGNGARLVLVGTRVVTVLARHQLSPSQLVPMRNFV